MIRELDARFGIPDVVRIEAGPGGLVRVVVTTAAVVGHVYLHGAHVTHHQPTGEQPLLFTSPRSQYAVGKAIRGGVPVIFPWFGARAGHPDAPEHGFARTAEWALESVERTDGDGIGVSLRLDPNDAIRAAWPHDFRLCYRVVFGTRLGVTLEVENHSRGPFTFEEALHTYLRVGDVRRVALSGIEDSTYIDKTDAMMRKVQGSGPMRLVGMTDRVFLATRGPHTIDDPVLGRRLVVEKRGSATTVVWNPWREKAAAMPDLGEDAWPSMLCVETANAADDAVCLGPGERHEMTATIGVEAFP